MALATGTGRRNGAMSGIATGVAILVRPNTRSLGFAIGVFLLLRPERTGPQRMTDAAY